MPVGGPDISEKESKYSCKGIQKNNNEITYQVQECIIDGVIDRETKRIWISR